MDYEKRLPGEAITLQCRKEAYEQVDKETMYQHIRTIMKEIKEPMTVREVSEEMYRRKYTSSPERQVCAPRITEMSQMGELEPCGKKECPYSHVNVTKFKLRNQS